MTTSSTLLWGCERATPKDRMAGIWISKDGVSAQANIIATAMTMRSTFPVTVRRRS